MGKYALPRLRDKSVAYVSTQDVMAVLVPHWRTKPEQMRKMKGWIGMIMKWAVAQGYREDNPPGPALNAAMPSNPRVKSHQRALPHADVRGALDSVRGSNAWASTRLCFLFTVLTAPRTGETRLARWSEIDLDAGVWVVPGERMKMGREHRVPLSRQAVAVLTEAAEWLDESGLIFPSVAGKALSDSTISKLIRELGIAAVPHGI